MQLWFWAAVTGMILAGISNFGFKIAAKKGFDADVFILYSGVVSVLFAGAGLLVLKPDGAVSAISCYHAHCWGCGSSGGFTKDRCSSVY
jgi:hypothetical protein